MKNRILFSGLKAVSLGLLAFMAASCNDDIDNYYSRNQSEITIEGSGEYIKLDESKPDEVALTIDWSPAHDYGYDYVTTYQYEMRVSGSGGSIEEYEDEGKFHREYTNAELQDLLVNHFGITTSTVANVTFTITATFEGPTLKVPDVETKTVKIKTYGPKQFVADTLYMAGTAVGDGRVVLSPSEADAQVYSYTGRLEAGTINFPVVNFDEYNAIGPENPDTPIELSDMPAVITDQAEANYWVVPEADNYRITVNLSEHTVRIVAAGAVVDVDQMFLAGTAVGDEQVEIAQTLENENLYAWRGELQAGTLYLPLTYEGTQEMSIVPAAAGDSDIHDGAQQSFTQVATSTAAASRGWEIPAAGTYRIVVNKEEKTITIYSAATDLKNMEVSYNNTTEGINPYTIEVTKLWMWGSFNKSANDPGLKPGFQEQYTLQQSLADPCVFVYSGEPLPRENVTDAYGVASVGAVKFLVANHENNVYAYGSTADAKRNDHNGYTEVTSNAPQTLVAGQGDNRYAFFCIPEGCNFVVVNIRNLTVVFDQK